MTSARMRRLASDYEEVKKNFSGHQFITVTPEGTDVPEKYHVTYFVNGIYLDAEGKVQILNRHEVEITLHADYPRYKPICRIFTPIWHPNFKDGQICIGDIWDAGESLSDIIVNIGDMIQYKSWNASSPLSADAARWAIENKHLFPVGNADLNFSGEAPANKVDIDLQGENPFGAGSPFAAEPAVEESGNDIEITAEELAGIEFVSTAQRMQTLRTPEKAKGKVNFKTILVKGLLWALIGAFLGFGVSELTKMNDTNAAAAKMMGYSELASYMEYTAKADAEIASSLKDYEEYCKQHGLDSSNTDNMQKWLSSSGTTEKANKSLEKYENYNNRARTALENSLEDEFDGDSDALLAVIPKVSRFSTALWAAVIALFIGLFLGIGEGVYYGSGQKAAVYALIGAAVSMVLGFASGYLAQLLYSKMLSDNSGLFVSSLIRAIGWAIMGAGIGLGAGLIKPNGKRILFSVCGGTAGAFIGGFLFNYVCEIVPNDVVARGVAIVIMGGLIGVGIGLLEQFAKQAWLKVIRGEFEGKEYLVFDGITSIGNNARNTIVLFKDKLVAPHHCDILYQGGRYSITDCGTPIGTIVNGQRITKQNLKHGDSIAVGNSVLIFNTK